MANREAREREFRFKIDAYTPATIPMARLAEYMTHVAMLFGEPAMVHFVRIEGGSLVLVQRVDREAVPKVENRLNQVRRGDAPPEALTAYRTINNKLREDNGSAVIFRDPKTEIMRFPGREEVEQVTFGSFNQEGSLDGVVIRVGGRQELVPVHLESGDIIYSSCEANRSLAKLLAQHIFSSEIRVYGTGRWYRNEDGRWVLDRFRISSFDVLRDAPLSSVVAGLRQVKGSEWETLSDPWSELEKIRRGTDGDN